MSSKKEDVGAEQRDLFQDLEQTPARESRPLTKRKESGEFAPIPEDFTPLQRQVIEALRQPDTLPSPLETQPDRPDHLLPARMLNEFVYCPRLFYYEHVEGIFRESEDTVRGSADHKRVDAGSGAMPKAKAPKPGEESIAALPDAVQEPEVIHSRSVTLGSAKLGVLAKMDLVEIRTTNENDGPCQEITPVDYKAGAPKPGPNGQELWDTDRMQLGLQCLILRENGYTCTEGIIYYRETRQRVRMQVTVELEHWILDKITQAREVAASSTIPPPLIDSPKCPRCSLAPVCLPDETALLKVRQATEAGEEVSGKVRRLLAPRDETRVLYLNTPGLHVGCRSQTLVVKDKESVVDELRIKDVDHVALFGNIQLSTQALQNLCEAEIPISYFSMGGWFYGLTRGHGLKNIFTRIEQFKQSADPHSSLQLARCFVHGKIRNQRTLLMRNHVEPPADLLLKLKNSSEKALRASNLGELLGIEGAAAAFYFQAFPGMLKPEEPDEIPGLETPGTPAFFSFDFEGRNRRPPCDPVNALLSLAYSILAKDCTLAALAVGFDPYLGFYHQPRFGRPALALDLMEEFRPILADSVVITLINNRMLTPGDFVQAGQAVNLTQTGRKTFFNAYEKRMTSLVTHPVFDYKVSYRRALELQFRILARVLTGEIPEYQPFTTR